MSHELSSERLVETLEAERDRLAARVRELEGALRKYGRDTSDCNIVQYNRGIGVEKKCTCGFEAALAAQPDRRVDMGSRADNYKNLEPPHIRGA